MADTYSLTPEQVARLDRMDRDQLRAEVKRTGLELELRTGGIFSTTETNETLTDIYDYASERMSEC